jgi:hypothetical protein
MPKPVPFGQIVRELLDDVLDLLRASGLVT